MISARESYRKMSRKALGVMVAASALTFAVMAVPSPVLADGATKADPKCQCRYQGQRFNLGEYACIRSKLARCDMFLNNTSWTFLDDSCGAVHLEPLPQSKPAATLAGYSQHN